MLFVRLSVYLDYLRQKLDAIPESERLARNDNWYKLYMKVQHLRDKVEQLRSLETELDEFEANAMSLINNDMVEQYAHNRGIVLRGDRIDSELWHQLLVEKKPIPQNFKDRLDHLEELRIQMWQEKGFQKVDGKWKKQ